MTTLTSGRLWNLAGWPTWTPLLSGFILAGGFASVWWQKGFWRGPAINPSDRLTLSLFVTAAVLTSVGVATIARCVRNRPIADSEGLRVD